MKEGAQKTVYKEEMRLEERLEEKRGLSRKGRKGM